MIKIVTIAFMFQSCHMHHSILGYGTDYEHFCMGLNIRHQLTLNDWSRGEQ